MLPPTLDPLSPPCWRWERARWLREGGRYARKGREDEFTMAAKAFQADQARCHNVFDQEAMAQKYPGLYQAWRIWEQADRPERWSVEGYVLGRATTRDLVAYAGLSPGAVVWNLKLFFDVAGRLEQDAYIVNTVMGAQVHHGMTEREYGLLWKMVGYGLGHRALREWMRPVKQQWVREADQFAPALDLATEEKFRKKNFIAIHTMPVYNNQQIIFEAWNKAREIARLHGAEGQSLMATNIHAALCALPFVVGKQGVVVASPRLAYYDEQGVELRAHEEVAVAVGQETDAHRNLLEWKYPEAREPQPVNAGGQG